MLAIETPRQGTLNYFSHSETIAYDVMLFLRDHLNVALRKQRLCFVSPALDVRAQGGGGQALDVSARVFPRHLWRQVKRERHMGGSSGAPEPDARLRLTVLADPAPAIAPASPLAAAAAEAARRAAPAPLQVAYVRYNKAPFVIKLDLSAQPRMTVGRARDEVAKRLGFPWQRRGDVVLYSHASSHRPLATNRRVKADDTLAFKLRVGDDDEDILPVFVAWPDDVQGEATVRWRTPKVVMMSTYHLVGVFRRAAKAALNVPGAQRARMSVWPDQVPVIQDMTWEIRNARKQLQHQASEQGDEDEEEDDDDDDEPEDNAAPSAGTRGAVRKRRRLGNADAPPPLEAANAPARPSPPSPPDEQRYFQVSDTCSVYGISNGSLVYFSGVQPVQQVMANVMGTMAMTIPVDVRHTVKQLHEQIAGQFQVAPDSMRLYVREKLEHGIPDLPELSPLASSDPNTVEAAGLLQHPFLFVSVREEKNLDVRRISTNATATVHVTTLTTVGELKAHLQAPAGSMLVLNAVELDDDSRYLVSVGAFDANAVLALHDVVKGEEDDAAAPGSGLSFLQNIQQRRMLNIQVRFGGDTSEYNVSAREAVVSLKWTLASKFNRPVELLHLRYGARALEDAKSLADYDIKAGTTIDGRWIG